MTKNTQTALKTILQLHEILETLDPSVLATTLARDGIEDGHAVIAQLQQQELLCKSNGLVFLSYLGHQMATLAEGAVLLGTYNVTRIYPAS